MKVDELSGPELDFYVAKADGWKVARLTGELEGRVLYMLAHPDRPAMVILANDQPFAGSLRYQPTTDWGQGGPIIERERIAIVPGGPRLWGSFRQEPGVDAGRHWIGPTPLIAAMRAYVASKFGDTVEAP